MDVETRAGRWGSRLGVGGEALIVHLETALAQAIHTPRLFIVTLFCKPGAIFRAIWFF